MIITNPIETLKQLELISVGIRKDTAKILQKYAHVIQDMDYIEFQKGFNKFVKVWKDIDIAIFRNNKKSEIEALTVTLKKAIANKGVEAGMVRIGSLFSIVGWVLTISEIAGMVYNYGLLKKYITTIPKGGGGGGGWGPSRISIDKVKPNSKQAQEIKKILVNTINNWQVDPGYTKTEITIKVNNYWKIIFKDPKNIEKKNLLQKAGYTFYIKNKIITAVAKEVKNIKKIKGIY